jgi:nucleoside-diphosphate-sugar epimerase
MSEACNMENELKGKAVLVTGGAGFIGSHITEWLVRAGSRVKVLDNLCSGKKDNLTSVFSRIEFIEGDIRDPKALSAALEGVSLVCHQAALRSVPKSVERPLEYNDVNVNGTLSLFVKARQLGIKRIACASSSSVYGERFDFPEVETDKPDPVSPYAASKLAVEDYSGSFNALSGMEIVNLRYFNVFGPRQSLDDEYAVVIPKFIACLLAGNPAPIYGDGEQERDFTYIDTVVRANLAVLTKEGLRGQVVNVASGSPQSVNSLYNTLKTIIGSASGVQYLAPRAGDVRKTHADISKMTQVLGVEPGLDFKEGLQLTADWFKDKAVK